ncbi:MAG TPA: hypothetical protein VFA18_24530 [Gemmataceae bacterium]|nr:hypothetical protein [Gemmataceae bacterium]
MDDGTIIAPDGTKFSVILPSGTAEVYANYGAFPGFADLDPLTRRMMFELAKAGDMAIMGDCLIILTNPAQPRPSWASSQWLHLCQSMEELDRVLDDCVGPYESWRDSALGDVPSRPQAERTYVNLAGKIRIMDALGGERNWTPGSRPEASASFVYLAAQPQETASSQQKKLYKYVATAPDPEGSGMMIAEFWRLDTPAGQRFYAYGYGGEEDRWLAKIRAFASAEGRAIGWIEGFHTFVQNDGYSFPLSACTCTKAKD